MPRSQTRRSGGRAARRALRAAPLEKSLRPVRPGLSGGRYRPLSETDMARIHRAALDALAEIGLADAPASGIEAMCAAGATLGADGRLRYSHALIEDMLARPRPELVLHGRDPAHDLEISGARVHYGTAAPPCTWSTSTGAATAKPPPRTSSTPRASPTGWTISTFSSARWWRATSPTISRWT